MIRAKNKIIDIEIWRQELYHLILFTIIKLCMINMIFNWIFLKILYTELLCYFIIIFDGTFHMLKI